MIRLTINIFAFVLMIFLSNTYAQYDLSTIDGIKGCMSDNNCYVCTNLLDNGSFEAKQCVQLSPYDEKLGIIDSTKSDLVCNAPSSTKVCSIETDDEILDNKTITVQIPYEYNFLDSSVNFKLNENILTINNNFTIDIIEKINNNKNFTQHNDSGWTIKSFIVKGNYYPYNKTCQKYGKEYKCNIPAKFFTITDGDSITKETLYTIYPSSCKCIDGYSDTVKLAPLLTVNVILERPKTTITCPYGSNYPCYLENNEYICNKNKCDAGSNMDVTENPEQGTPVIKPPKKEGIESGCVEDMSKVTIAEGTLGMCRLSSRTNALADNCCKISVNDRDKQEDIMTGVADVISVIGGTYSLISDLFKALGWADEDFIQVLLTDVIEFIKGGTCSNDEIAIATAAAATQGIVVNNNGITYDGNNDSGTCVYLGDYCTNYSGTCHKWFGQIIGWDGQCERPARAYCCYSSMFEKALAKAAREQMPDKYNWGNIRGNPVWPYKSKFGEPYTPGNNPCEPDFKELNIDCKGVSVFDLININMDSEQFQTDMAAFTAITLKDVTKEGGNYQQAQENMQQEIDNLKNQSNTNSGAIIDNMLDGVDINKFK